MSEQTLGVAILGYGFIGKVHALAHVAMPLLYSPPPLRTRLVGVATATQTSAEKAAATGLFEVVTIDQMALIHRDDVQIVHICTPNDTHLSALLAAIAAGKHIYCDKPLTATLTEAEQVGAVLPAYRGTAQMTLQYRFWPATLRAKQLVDEGRIGRVAHFRAAYLHAGSVDPAKPLNWKADAGRGGGVLADLGSHVIDLVQHLLGPIEPLHVVQRVWSPGRESLGTPGRPIAEVGDDCTILTCRTADGAPGVIEASKIASGCEDELRVEIHGQRGALRFNLMDPNVLEFCDLAQPDSPHGGLRGWTRIATVSRFDGPAQLPGPKNGVGWLRGHAHCLHNFLSDVAAGRPGEPGLEVGIELQRTLAAVAELGRGIATEGT